MLTYSCPLEGSAAQCVEMSVRVVKHDDAQFDVNGCFVSWFSLVFPHLDYMR